MHLLPLIRGAVGLFFRSEPPGLVFSATYLRGSLAPLRILDFVELWFPPLLSSEKTAPSRQSRQKNPPTPLEEPKVLFFTPVSSTRCGHAQFNNGGGYAVVLFRKGRVYGSPPFSKGG